MLSIKKNRLFVQAEDKIMALIWKIQGTIKNPLWARLPAAKLNDRGWKPFPQTIQLVRSR